MVCRYGCVPGMHMLWYVDMVVFLSCVVIKALLDKQIPQLHTYILHSMFDMWTICWVVKGCHHMKSIKEALWSSESSGSTGSYQQGHHGHHYQQSGSQQLKISWYTSGSGDLYQLERGMQAYIYDNFGNLWWNFCTKLLYISKFICIYITMISFQFAYILHQFGKTVLKYVCPRFKSLVINSNGFLW